ncbi:MAG TPA: chalcone isomerase family protein [Noviherbaspirillum sp.]
MDVCLRSFRALLGFIVLAFLSAALPAGAAEVAGVKLEQASKVAGQELRLNGAGIRYRAIFKVYVAALYLPQPQKSVETILSAPGARRVQLVMLRDVGSEDMSRAFISGIQNNSTQEEKARIVSQLQRISEIFASIPELKKGDVLNVDWLPASGTAIYLNGKQISDAIPERVFYNALLKIWLGEQPADSGLKNALLGLQG